MPLIFGFNQYGALFINGKRVIVQTDLSEPKPSAFQITVNDHEGNQLSQETLTLGQLTNLADVSVEVVNRNDNEGLGRIRRKSKFGLSIVDPNHTARITFDSNIINAQNATTPARLVHFAVQQHYIAPDHQLESTRLNAVKVVQIFIAAYASGESANLAGQVLQDVEGNCVSNRTFSKILEIVKLETRDGGPVRDDRRRGATWAPCIS